MNKGRLILISGAMGSGKTTIASLLSTSSIFNKLVLINWDTFFNIIKKGYISPSLKESNKQNEIVITSYIKVASEYLKDGYDVIIEGIIGPWFLYLFDKISKKYKTYYFILRLDLKENERRIILRDNKNKEENLKAFHIIYPQFLSLKDYEKYVLNTTTLTNNMIIEKIIYLIKSDLNLLKE